MAIHLTLDHLKTLAHKSKPELAREGLTLGHKQLLDLQARIHGFTNYEQAKAQLERPIVPALLADIPKVSPLPDLPPDIALYCADPVQRRPGARLPQKEAVIARKESRSQATIDYLLGDARCDAADDILYLMLGWQIHDLEYGQSEGPHGVRQFDVCRLVLELPECAGREREIARLGGRWVEYALRWQELCSIHDAEGRDDPDHCERTLASMSVVVTESDRRSSAGQPDIMAYRFGTAMAKNYPSLGEPGWYVTSVHADGTPFQTVDSERPILAQIPRGFAAMTAVKFGQPRLLCVVPMKDILNVD